MSQSHRESASDTTMTDVMCIYVSACVWCTMSALFWSVFRCIHRGDAVWAPCCPYPDTHTHTHSSGLMTSCTSDSHGVSLPVKLKYHRRCEKWTVMYVTVLVGSIQVNACGACHSSGLCTGGGNLCTYRQFYMGAARLCRRPSRLSDGW